MCDTNAIFKGQERVASLDAKMTFCNMTKFGIKSVIICIFSCSYTLYVPVKMH